MTASKTSCLNNVIADSREAGSSFTAIAESFARHSANHASGCPSAEEISNTRMTGGNWHHGELALDQMLMLRPVPGAAQYRTPLDGLYLCGAGSHPGGGVMGAAGLNAANQVIRREAAA